MKKIILVLMLIMPGIVMAWEAEFSQEELLERMKPLLREGKVYGKFKEIDAMEAQGGEVIETVTTDGLETKNIAKKGDYIVRNTTDAMEMYVIKRDKFSQRYEYKGDLTGDWKIYGAVGKIKGVKVDSKVIKDLDTGNKFYFMAPWGEKMVVKKGDYLVSPLDYSEIYRVAEKEFFETYREEK